MLGTDQPEQIAYSQCWWTDADAGIIGIYY